MERSVVPIATLDRLAISLYKQMSMTQTLSISEARARLLSLAQELARRPRSGAVAVTRRGRPVLAVMPWEIYESLVETLEVLSDEDLMGALREGVRQARAGKGVPLAKLRRSLGL